MTEEDDILAAELALGVLEGPELAAAEARAAHDVGFAAAVEEWRTRLAPMLAVDAEAPSDRLWQGISSRLAANDEAPSSATERALRRWRTIGIGASALAASLALVLVTRAPIERAPQIQSPPEVAATSSPMVATLLDEQGGATIVTISMAAPDRLIITPVRMAEDRRVPELWIIPDDGKPRSLGVMPSGGPSSMPVPRGHMPHLRQGATFAISREPQGGSPTGAPTGPVIAAGKITTI